MLEYRKLFDGTRGLVAKKSDRRRHEAKRVGDLLDGSVYIYDVEEKIELAVNVALSTGRPLLVRGPSGSGKSTLAPRLAKQFNYRYCPSVITSRTQARDLLWRFDAVGRLGDAAPGKLGAGFSPHAYVTPGVLWWAFNPATARTRGRSGPAPKGEPPPVAPGWDGKDDTPAVVLLDEIDKADPDVPNDLLRPLGSLAFDVDELALPVTCIATPLIIITSNDERELSLAFRRRCVELNLAHPKADQMEKIAVAHFVDGKPDDQPLYKALALRVEELRVEYKARNLREPSTAEYLDAVRACVSLQIRPGTPAFELVIKATLDKGG